MAKLLTGTRIYGTGTVDTQLFVSGTNSATSTTTGALQVVGGVGIGGNLHVGGIIYGAILGTATTATNSDNVKTVLTTSTSVFFPVFVDSNNATAGYEAVYSSSTFTIIPSSGNVGIGAATPTEKLHVAGNYILLKNTADTAAGAVFDSGSTLGQNTQILLRDRGSDKWAVRKNNANNFDIYGSAAGAVAFTIFSSTNFVGIGATVIEDVLHVRRDSATTSTGIVIQNRSASGLPEAGIKFITGPLDLADTRYAEISSTGTTSPSLIFKTGGGTAPTERMRITAQGGVAFGGATNYGTSGQILQSNGNAAPTWISTGSLAAANATTATHLSGGVAGQIPYQTAPGVTAFLSTGTAGDVLVSNGSSAATYNNTLRLAGSTNATSTSSGALQVVGGVGVGGDLFIQGDIRTNDILFNLINANATTVNFAGDATALTMGASGSGTTNVRNNLTVSGNLTVQGTTTIVDSTVTNIADPIITLGGGTGNTAPTADDNKDRGVAFKWVNNAGTTSTGFFGYDDSTGYLTYVQTATITNEVVSGTKGAMDVNLAGGTAMSVVYQSSPNNTAFLAASTSGYLLQTNGTGSAPSWVSASGVSAGSATYADNVRTIAQTANAVYFPTFVDSNNASNAYESLYTTSSFSINPATGVVTITAPAGGDGVPSLRLTQGSAPSTFNWVTSFINSSLTAGKNAINLIGQAESGNNSAYFGFKYVGASSASNFATIGLYGADNLLNVLANGNVGIGATSPAQKLDVRGYIVSDVNSNAVEGGFYLGNSGHGIRRQVATNDVYVYTAGGTLYLTANGSTSTQVAIVNSGNVGIGTTTPAYKLEVASGTSGQQSLVNFRTADSTTANNAGIQIFATPSATATSRSVAIVWDADGANSAGVDYFVINKLGNSGEVQLQQYSNAAMSFTTNSTERLRITAAGGISFGATGTAYGTSGQVLKSNGDASPTWVDPSTLASASATNADNIRTVAQTANATYYPTFVDSNNASNAYELVYTTGTIVLNPSYGSVGIGANPSINSYGSATTSIKLNLQHTPPQNTTVDDVLRLSSKFISASNTASAQIGSGPAIVFAGGIGDNQSRDRARIVAVYEGGNVSGLAFHTQINADTLVEAMRITNNGRVGIGTTSTSAKLHVTSSGEIARFESSGGTGRYVRFNDSGATKFNFIIGVQQNVDNGFEITPSTTAGGSTFSTPALAITSAGGISFGGAASYGSSGQVLQSNGNAAPTWINQSSIAAGSAPLTNTYVGYGSASNLLTGSSNFTWDGTKLLVSGTSISPYIKVSGTGGLYSYIQLDDSSSNGYLIKNVSSGTGNGALAGALYTYTDNNKAFQHIHAGTPLFTILSTGNVGIGTTAPDSKLHVEVGNATAYTPANTLVSGQTARISNTDGTSGVSANLLFVAKGAGGGNGLGSISGVNTGVGSLAFTFGTRHASSNVTERMRITSDGNVVIGATTTTNKFEVAGNAGQLFSVSDSFTGTIFSANDVSGIPSIEVLDTGLVKFAQYGGQVAINTGTVASSTASLSVYGMIYTMGTLGEIRASSEITAYYSSDRRLKENIKLIENPITIIDQIRGVTFDWTDEHMARRGGEDGYFVRKHDIGVIAQEVQAVLPELVGTREDGYLAVKYEKMVPLLIEAIKAQQKTIDSLVNDLDTVKEFINNLKNGI